MGTANGGTFFVRIRLCLGGLIFGLGVSLSPSRRGTENFFGAVISRKADSRGPEYGSSQISQQHEDLIHINSRFGSSNSDFP